MLNLGNYFRNKQSQSEKSEKSVKSGRSCKAHLHFTLLTLQPTSTLPQCPRRFSHRGTCAVKRISETIISITREPPEAGRHSCFFLYRLFGLSRLSRLYYLNPLHSKYLISAGGLSVCTPFNPNAIALSQTCGPSPGP